MSGKPSDPLSSVLIFGAGPAGVLCASMLARNGLQVLLVDEQGKPGGALLRYGPSQSDLGLPSRTSPKSLLRRMAQDAAHPKIRLLQRRLHPDDVKPTPDGSFMFGEETFSHLVIATGAKPRGVAHVDMPDWKDRVRVGPGRLIDELPAQGKRIAILGCGDNAMENAVALLDRGALSVDIFCRSRPAASPFWLKRAQRAGAKLWFGQIQWGSKGIGLPTESACSDSSTAGAEQPFGADYILILCGYEASDLSSSLWRMRETLGERAYWIGDSLAYQEGAGRSTWAGIAFAWASAQDAARRILREVTSVRPNA